ncbi:MAG: hypothetical protein IJA15_06330 [Clostridia bacterium]|nr:hypothetical protein [Clostridia bacterium]
MNRFFQALLSFALIFITSVSIVCLKQMQKPLFDCDYGVYTYYKYSKSSSCQIYTGAVSSIKKPFCLAVQGQSLFLDFSLYGKSFCVREVEKSVSEKKGFFVFEESGEWGVSRYYYSKQIPFYCVVNNNRVNLQVSVSKNGITIGSPLIFGSY